MKTSRLVPVLLLVGGALSACPTAPKPDPIPAAPTIERFTATPGAIDPGGEVTLQWKATNATKVTITDVARGAVSGVDDAMEGSVKVLPPESALYVLTAENERGARATAVASVTVSGGADTIIFSAWPEVVAAGETSTLLWAAPGAHVVSITPAGGAALDLHGQVETGSVSVEPAAAETTYTLDVDGQTRTVTVRRVPAITRAEPSSPLAQPGDDITLTWETSDATEVTVSSPGLGALHTTATAEEAASGTFTHTVPELPNGAVLNYLVEARGPGGATREAVRVYIGLGPVLVDVTAPTYVKVGSTATLGWKTLNADAVQVRADGQVLFETHDLAKVANGQAVLPAPAGETTYTVAALSTASGLEVTRALTVGLVDDVTISTFTATPLAVDGGEAVTLTWDTPNARRVRIEQSDLFPVVALEGAAAESGTVTVYPNAATTTFTLTADNTVDPAETASIDVTVGTRTALQGIGGATVFASGGMVELEATAGSAIEGLPLAMPDFEAVSTTFEDISATGKALTFSNTDNGAAQFTPWAFQTQLFGVPYAGVVSATTNGFLVLGSSATTTATPPTTFPGTVATYNGTIAPFWGDLALGPDGQVLWEVRGQGAERRLIVQWDHVRAAGAATSVLTFQARITQTGVITFDYQTLDGLPTSLAAATALQASGGKIRAGAAAAGASLTFFGRRTLPVQIEGSVLPVSGYVDISGGFSAAKLEAFVPAGAFGISEVLYSPAAGVAAGQWFEVFNNSTTPVDLQGWTIDFGGGSVATIGTALEVPADGVILLGQSSDTAENDGVNVAWAWGNTFSMDDTQGSLTLSNGASSFTATWAPGLGGPGVSMVYDDVKLLGRSNSYDVVMGPCSSPAGSTFGSQSPPQLGTPGALSSCFARMSVIPEAFHEISGTGTLMPFTSWDDQTQTLSLASAPITLQGVTVTQVTVGTNGFITATATTTSGITNKLYPSSTAPLGTLAVFWDDLNRGSSGTGGIYSQRFGAGEDPATPAPHWIIEWKNYTHYAAGDTLDFQAKLFDDGTVEYHYATMTSGSTSNYAAGSSATIWLENADGTGALPFSLDQPNITPHMAIRFRP